MYILFSRIILANWRSLLVLFFVILFSSTGFLTLRQITTNIESLVASETRPLFGADIMISPRSYASGDVLPLIREVLEGEDFVAAERREFSTTLFDREGKTGLVQVVAYSGTYPQRGILELEGAPYAGGVVVTSGLSDRFSISGALTLDGRALPIAGIIRESSDLGFSLGTENHLVVLPSDLLSGSLLLSSGSRLDHDLLISFSDERRAESVKTKIETILFESDYRIRTYEDRTERNLETVDTLTDYITLILLVSSVFAFVILRSAHESFFESLARTLRITHILGLTQVRQRILFLLLYTFIFPLALLCSLGLSSLIITLLQSIPEAADFRWFWRAIPGGVFLLSLIVIMAWYPDWQRLGGEASSHVKVVSNKSLGRYKEFFQALGSMLTRETIITLLLSITILFLLFSDILFSLAVGLGAGVFFLLFSSLLKFLYRQIWKWAKKYEKSSFFRYDGIRALVRPLTPSIPITLSLVSVTVFFLVFSNFSLSFRGQLRIDTENTANIYAINILEEDRKSVEQVISSGALFYDILRARVIEINNKTLAEHLGVDRPSGEFTREFNVTTTELDIPVREGKEVIGKGEVSVDYDFSERLGVDIGDRITFLLSGREITLTVANIRESVREGFRPFFYFSFDPIEFQNAPRTYFIAEYAPDTELWKRTILGASGPHVTFIDIENILSIVRDISGKVLSVIGLFALFVSLFALGAVIAFFSRMRPIESMKRRLYGLFGASRQDKEVSIRTTRVSIFLVSYFLSVLLGGVLSYFSLSFSDFFEFSFSQYLILSGATLGIYGALMIVLRR